ncbi:Predicted membrane protein [Acinetobacter haemolyticus]|nr:Predicted membrane protein [Acinetobacter haemolyticus]
MELQSLDDFDGIIGLSSVVVRAMHHYFNTPLWSVEIWSNGDVQLSLTLLWVILAFILMTFSSRRHLRQIWFVGAALLAIVVAKLLLLDLSQSGTLTRVISFIGSGAIMLVIAYLAPLPPALDQTEKES